MALAAFSFALSFQSLHPTALIDAVFSGDYDKVESLLKSGVDIDEQDVNGFTAVMVAAAPLHYRAMAPSEVPPSERLKISARLKILALLLQNDPDLDKQDKQGKTVVMHAVQDVNLEAVELLLQHCPDLSKQDNDGYTAYWLAFNHAMLIKGPAVEVLDKILKSLSSKIMIPEHLNILAKCCYLSFEQKDPNGIITQGLISCLESKIISITSPQLLNLLFSSSKSIQECCQAGKLTILASRFKLADNLTPQFIVIIPESLKVLGIKIPKSEQQNEKPSIDISNIENKYGFKNLTLINPTFVTSLVEHTQEIKPDELQNVIENLPEIINTKLPQHPTRFYLDGHGQPGIIATIPTNQFEHFLSKLSEIGAEFIYITSCYAGGGANLQKIQSDLLNIITRQIEERKKSSAAPFPGIDFAIVIQATSDVATVRIGDIRAMFTKLNEFLKEPVWALTFGPQVEKSAITIADVIADLKIKDRAALPSIRLPGKTGFFRSINIGDMEIITESTLIELGVERTLKLIAESNDPNKIKAEEAKKKLAGNLEIVITIKPDTQFIQIFPVDLMDFTFDLQGEPRFISKLSGQGQHYIGKIIGAAYESGEAFKNSFFDVWAGGGGLHRCWFIKCAEIGKTNIKKLAINLYSTLEIKQHCEYAYINEKGEYIISKEDGTEAKKDKETFESTIRKWFQDSIPSQQTLTEATGGIEVTAEEKARLEKEKGGTQALKLLEPKFARTPQDLFNMFISD